jgi:hypothetical protein
MAKEQSAKAKKAIGKKVLEFELDVLSTLIGLSIVANELMMHILHSCRPDGVVAITREFREGFLEQHRYSRQSYYKGIDQLIRSKLLTKTGSVEAVINLEKVRIR